MGERLTTADSPGGKESETLLAIVRALKTFDLTNLRKNKINKTVTIAAGFSLSDVEVRRIG